MRYRHLLCCVAGMLFSAAAAADIIAVSATPASQNIAVDRAVLAPLRWTVTRVEGNCLSPSITSPELRVFGGNLNGPLLAAFSRTLSQTVPCSLTPVTNTFQFPETVTLPPDLARRALQAGYSSLAVARTFDNGVASTGEAQLLMASAAATPLSITAVRLRLAEGGSVRVLPRGAEVKVVADIEHSGGGLLQAVWELAEPASTAGEPVFRPLQLVREMLTPGESQTLTSPVLPSTTQGLYLLRLRITEPAASFAPPVLRYVVGESGVQTLQQQSVILLSPAPAALLDDDTLFRWQPVQYVVAYRLELFLLAQSSSVPDLPALDGSEPLPDAAVIAQALALGPDSGMLLDADTRTAALSSLARDKLLPGRDYLWRVVALGADGEPVGSSPVRLLGTP